MVDLSWQRAGTWRTKSGHMAGTWWTHGEHMAYKVWRQGEHMADTRRAHGGQMAGKVWRGGPKQTQGSQGGHMAETWHSRRTQGGQTADTWRTKCGDAAKAESRRTQGEQWRTSRPAFFLLRENPTVNCLGKHPESGAATLSLWSTELREVEPLLVAGIILRLASGRFGSPQRAMDFGPWEWSKD